MRGLNIRADYALAKVLMAVNLEAASEQKLMALVDAECMGRGDYYSDQDETPVLFRDEPELVRAWTDGWNASGDLAEMEACSGCNDGTGNPCHIHG